MYSTATVLHTCFAVVNVSYNLALSTASNFKAVLSNLLIKKLEAIGIQK